MEWVVGQWVECVESCNPDVQFGAFYKIDKPSQYEKECHVVGVHRSLSCKRFKPFTWQVGRTYRTTMEGVTATITKIDRWGYVRGTASNSLVKGNEWTWSPVTGRMYGCESCEHEPHLLPFLADELSEPEPTLTERFTVEQVQGRWAVVDSQESRWNPCGDHETAVRVLGVVKGGQVIGGWVGDDYPGNSIEARPSPQLKSRYHRTIKGVTIDLYDIAVAYGVTGHAEFHALKKIIMAGDRGYKDRDQDLAEAIMSIERAREMAKGGAE